MAERDPELQRLIDESAIRNLIAKYPRALDRHDHALHASLFHPDAIDNHGVFDGPASGFVEFMAKQSTPGVHWMHHYGTQLIELTGDVANVETYCLAFCRKNPIGAPGPDREMVVHVRYLDRVEKRDGEWRISVRQVVYAPCHVRSIEQEFLHPGCVLERGFPTDLVYNR